MTDFQKLLNPEQCAAATAPDGPLLVLAAAGTGKTRTLVHRVAYLIENGVPADRILLLTFTNRAAREMLDRARQLIGDQVAGIWSGTFHSVCARLLRRYGSALGYRADFQILDEEDQKKLIGEIIKATVADPKDFPKKELVAKMISEAQNESRPIELVAARWQTKVAGFTPAEIVAIADKYAAKKLELGAMDFDDLLVNGLRLLKEKTEIRERLQERFLHVLVDEYQDTNGLQAEFTDILAARHRNILAVGDDFQCIYTWRGAQIENIMEFPKRWDGCRVVKLERNYRSVPGVLNVANVVMRDAPNQFEKTLRPFRGAATDDRPWVYRVYDDEAQASEIVRIVTELHRDGFRHADMAVLYRSHFQSIRIQMAFARRGVPHRITSGVGVFEQVHTKDVLAYLRLIVNPADELSFRRFVCLFPGVGEKGAVKFWDRLGRQFDMRRKEDREALYGLLGAKAKPVFAPLVKAMERVGEYLDDDMIGEIVGDFCSLFYDDCLHREFEEADADDRLEDVRELAAQIASARPGEPEEESVDEARGGGWRKLETFLSEVALMTNLDVRRNDPNLDRVTLSTVHQAKGMEWPVVIVPWLCETMFPSGKAVEENRMDEERRLFYVAVTRAKDKLYLFVPQMRKMADGGIFPVDPSQFVKEIPPALYIGRRIQSAPAAGGYGGYGNRGGYGGRSGYGGGYGSRNGYGGGSSGPKTVVKYTWRKS